MITHRYGIQFPVKADDLTTELFAFRHNWPVAKGGLGRYGHLANLIQVLTPDRVAWNPWFEWSLRTLCDNDFVFYTGCASAGKTFSVGVFAYFWWMAGADCSAVILTSTTGNSIRRRAWPVIQRLFDRKLGFNLVDSRTTLQFKKGDDLHGIFAKAVKEGPVSKAVADIQGIHPQRLMLVIDEATEAPEAIFEAIPNLSKGCSEFRLVCIGNATSHMDPHGRVCEPALGWNSVTVEDEEWKTRGVPQWQVNPGVCLHFDGLKSPNLKTENDQYPRIYGHKDLAKARANPEAEKTIGFWRYDRGFWAGEGICKTVLTEALLVAHDARGKHIFSRSFETIAGLDPSFTAEGDGCILRFAQLGNTSNGIMGIQLGDRIKIPLVPGKDIYYQISERVAHECKQRNVKASRLALDVTGGGKGVADILERDWEAGVHRVEFGGKSSDLPATLEDMRPGSEVYGNRVSELWYAVRELVTANQLKGIGERDGVEFCVREYDIRGNRIVLDPKDITREKIGRSPDDADAVAVLVDLARNMGVTPGGHRVSKRYDQWTEFAKQANDVYANVDYCEA